MTATVIKPSARHPHATAFSFDDLSTQADRYLGEVRAQAAKILADANREANAIRAQAEQQGLAAAMNTAEKELDERIDKQMKTLLPALSKAIAGIEQAKTSWLSHWEKNVVHLAARIAARVVRKEVVAEPAITLTLLREALELAVGGGSMTIRLNPADHAALGGQVANLASEFAKLAATDLVADPQIAAGGCRIETQFGTIDQTCAAQLARIEEELS